MNPAASRAWAARDAAVVALGAVLAASGVAPHDRFTWFLEVFWVIGAIAAWVLGLRRLPCSGVLFWGLSLHALVLIAGGHWTYERVPAGDWVRETLGLARNPYDRLGHLFQGLMPCLLTREILLRNRVVASARWVNFFSVAVPLAFSALFELFEWGMAEAFGSSADAFLGSQGDVWDAQWDMFCALLGALAAVLVLSRRQDRQVGGVPAGKG